MEENVVFQQRPLSPQEDSVRPHRPQFPFGIILKGIVGVIALLLVVFIATGVILPRIGNNTKEGITLTYWGLWEDSQVVEPVISEFEKENPSIKITYVKQDIKQYRDRLATRIQAGDGPDIFWYHNTWILQMSDFLAPLPSDVITNDQLQNQYFQVVQSDLSKDGAIFGIPTGMDTLALFVNTEILNASGIQIPQTWDEFLSAAVQVTVSDESGKIKTAGASLGTFNNISHAPDILSLLFVQNGANLQNLSSSKQNGADALNFYTCFAKDNDSSCPNNRKVWDSTLDMSVLAFSKGNLVLYFGYSWDIFIIKALNPELEFQIAPVPQLPGRKKTIASYWAYGVSAKSKHQKESMQFLKFLSKKETQQKIFQEQSKTRLFGQPYARKDLAVTLKNNRFIAPFVAQADNAVSSFFTSDTYDNGLNSQMNAYLENAVRAVLSNTSPQSAIETLSLGISQVLNQYGQ